MFSGNVVEKSNYDIAFLHSDAFLIKSTKNGMPNYKPIEYKYRLSPEIMYEQLIKQLNTQPN
jgi:hypothetical protein